MRSGLGVSLADTTDQQGVIGQDHACTIAGRTIARLKAGLDDPQRPVGTLLFAGPTGVGKTELAKQLARFLFGDAERLVRVDMSELVTGSAIARLITPSPAGTSLADLSFVETHYCFTIAELIEYEAMGLAAPGEGYKVVREGWAQKDGRLPINVSGGLKAKGHPIGATGVSMHVLACMQLMGEAGDMQVPGANLAGVFNMGGSAVANYVSILERSR